MRSGYRARHAFTPFLACLFFSAGFSQSTDYLGNTALTDSSNMVDSIAIFDNTTKPETDSNEYHVFTQFWDERNFWRINKPLRFTFPNLGPSPSMRYRGLPSGPEIMRKYGAINFQGSTAHQLSYADELYENYVLKPDYGNGMVVPILPMAFLALYGAREGILALRKDPPVSLEATDVEILGIIWNNPDIDAVNCYQLYNQNDSGQKLTFMTIRNRLDKLRDERLIDSRTDVEQQVHYTARYTRAELLQRLEEELNSNNAPEDLARNMHIQHMQMLLQSGHDR